MKSKTKIESQLRKKTNPILVETVIEAKKNPKWLEVASILTGSRRNKKDFNLTDVEKAKGEVIVICGKMLSQGEITDKKKIAALSFSKNALEKLKKAGCETILLKTEIQKNKEAKGVTILK